MAKRIPVSVAKEVANKIGARQVILCCWDGTTTHIVTYGKTVEDCAQAAAGGNMLKEKWGWPGCNDQPSRVKKLQTEVEKCRQEIVRQVQEIRRLEQLAKTGGPEYGF